MTFTEDTSNVWKRADYSEHYWDTYLEARPEYDESFYQIIQDYHESHKGLTELALDIGTGPGQVAAELVGAFKHVIASDINESHLTAVKHRLGPLISSKRVSLAEYDAEETANQQPPSSVDMVTVAECIGLMDASKAVDGFSKVLKPNGTLAIWFYGRPIFAEPEYAGTCQPLLNSILDLEFSKALKGGPQHTAAWKRATDRMTSFLDDIELTSDVWRDVERRKWNADHPMAFYGSEACNFEISPSSAIGPEEKVVEKKDLGLWERQWDALGVRLFLRAILPTFNQDVRDDEVEVVFNDLEEAMGGVGAVKRITWPVVLILASKK